MLYFVHLVDCRDKVGYVKREGDFAKMSAELLFSRHKLVITFFNGIWVLYGLTLMAKRLSLTPL